MARRWMDDGEAALAFKEWYGMHGSRRLVMWNRAWWWFDAINQRNHQQISGDRFKVKLHKLTEKGVKQKRFLQIFINFTATRFHLVCFVVFVFDGNALNYFCIQSNHLIVHTTYGEGQWTIDYLQWYLQRLFKVVGSSSFFCSKQATKQYLKYMSSCVIFFIPLS